MRVAIVGAGIAGLGSALALARDGHDVVVLERDATPLPHTPDEAFEWKRRGAPQVRHSHAFLARMRNLLRDRFPDVRDELLRAGATEVGWADMLPDTITDREPRPSDDDLAMICCRRTTFEWVLRRVALHTDRVELRDGVTVTGLLASADSSVPWITGVRTAGDDIPADIVLDCTGRPSRIPQLLHDHGVRVTETKSDTGIVYLSRFYRLREGVAPPYEGAFAGGDLEYVKIGIMRGDNGTFSITLAYATDDDDMRVLKEPGRFDIATQQIPMASVWFGDDACEPISGVQYMGGLINRVRHFVVDGTPIVHGLFAVGDSSVCTNPLYGRGCSLGMLHAVLFAQAVAEHGDDQSRVAIAFDDATERELVPWYVASKQQDAVNTAIVRGEPLSEFDAYIRSIVRDGVFPASLVDADVSRAWFRTFNLLTRPDGLLTNTDVMGTIMDAWNERHSREPAAPQGPDRETFLRAISEKG